MPRAERRQTPRVNANLLVSYREENSAPSPAGFVRALNLSERGMLLETPDVFSPGQTLSFDILLDFNHVAQVEGRIVWYKHEDKGLNRVGIEFPNLSRAQKKLIVDQVAKYIN